MLTIVDDRNLGFSLGASEFMTKPIDRNKLIGLLRKFAPSGDGTVVLIVDDDPDVRGVVKSDDRRRRPADRRRSTTAGSRWTG